MNLCEILKAIELNTNDINSIKNNSNTGCDCPYQVIIKSTLGINDTLSYELVKGDFNTAKSKIQAGEYIDAIVYNVVIKSNGKIIQFSFKLSSVSLIPAGEIGDNSPESIIIEWGNNMRVFWTEDALSDVSGTPVIPLS